MRWIFALIVVASPAVGWEYTSLPVCTVSHETDSAVIKLTYDPANAEPYAIAVTRTDAWTGARIFGLRFDGANALTITTDRQTSAGNTLTVRDQGFGNVLNGLEFNSTVTAFEGDTTVTFSLEGAAAEIARFRDCLIAPVA